MKKAVVVITILLNLLLSADLDAQVPLFIYGKDSSNETDYKCIIQIKPRYAENEYGFPCMTVREEKLDSLYHTGTLTENGDYLLYVRINNDKPAGNGFELSSVNVPFSLTGKEEKVCLTVTFSSLPPFSYYNAADRQTCHKGSVTLIKYFNQKDQKDATTDDDRFESHSGWDISVISTVTDADMSETLPSSSSGPMVTPMTRVLSL